MDAVAIGVIAFSVIFIIGSLIFAHYGRKASERMQDEEIKKERQEAIRNQKSKNK